MTSTGVLTHWKLINYNGIKLWRISRSGCGDDGKRMREAVSEGKLTMTNQQTMRKYSNIKYLMERYLRQERQSSQIIDIIIGRITCASCILFGCTCTEHIVLC